MQIGGGKVQELRRYGALSEPIEADLERRWRSSVA